MMGKLTALAVKAAVQPGRYHDGKGLMLLVRPGGSRSWVLRTQADGRRRDFGLGALTEVGLAEARDRADVLRKQFKSGIDPIEARRAARAALVTVPTFEEAARTLYEEQKSSWRNVKHRAQWLSSLLAYAFPALGTIKVDQVDGPMIRDMLLPIWLEKPETARRVRQRVGAVLDWCHAKGLRPSEAPMRSIGKGLPRQPKRDRHFAAMPYEDVPALMTRLSEADASGRLALQFVILTASRSGEVRGATWEEIDLDAATWTLPGERMKAGKSHIVPLCDAALAVLNRAKILKTGRTGEPVFPGLSGRIMSDMTLAKALKTAGAGEFTVHGFRSSFRDWAAEMTGTPGDVVEAALAHTIANRVEAAYRRTNYLDKRRLLMTTWAQFLCASTPNVVPIRSTVTR
jgi:integrase